jgi:hypothetical protein
LTGWPIHRLTDWPADRLKRLTGWPTDRLTGWPIDRLTDWPADRLTGWLQRIKGVVEKIKAAGGDVELFMYPHSGHAFMNALTESGKAKLQRTPLCIPPACGTIVPYKQRLMGDLAPMHGHEALHQCLQQTHAADKLVHGCVFVRCWHPA